MKKNTSVLQSREQERIQMYWQENVLQRCLQEKILLSKQMRSGRKDPFELEYERIKQQQNRQQKRKLEEMSALDVANKKCKSVKEGNLHDHQSYRIPDQKGFKSIKGYITQFHSNIAVGPVFVCTCCHQTWFRKSVSMLKNTHIPAQSKRLYCTKFASVHNEEWVCHTCLTALRNSNIPKLSVVNGMKWPEKPRELGFTSARRETNSTAYPIYVNKRMAAWRPVVSERKCY